MKRWMFFASLLVISSVIFTACNPLEKRDKAGLQVITSNIPASVFLNGQYLEKSPLIDRELKPGEYQLRIEPDEANLVPYETPIVLNKGLITVVTWKPGTNPEESGGVVYEMEKLAQRKQTEVSFTSIPDNAIIKISNRDKEFTPVVFSDLPPGEHEYEITLPSYETQKHTLNVVEGFRINVIVKLAKLDAQSEAEEAQTKQKTTPDQAATNGVDPFSNAESTQAANEASPSSATVIINKTGFFNQGVESLRVRKEPSASGQELGFAQVGKTYPYLDEKDNGWLKIMFNGQAGWVSGSYATIEE